MENKTAKEMYQLSSLALDTDTKINNLIKNVIRYDANRGRFQSKVEYKLDTSVLDGLIKLGYKISCFGCFGTYQTTIDWSDARDFYIIRNI